MVLSIVAFLTACALAGPGVLKGIQRADWTQQKPTWWLCAETRSSDPVVVGPALRELLRRYETGSLPDQRVRQLALQGLRYRDAGAPCVLWNGEYGNFLDIAWARGLTEEQRRNYSENAVGLWFHGPSQRNFAGDPRESNVSSPAACRRASRPGRRAAGRCAGTGGCR